MTSNRDAITETDDLDPITQDMLIAQTAELEKFQWFVRAHLENAAGADATTGESSSEAGAADASR